jgi:hypothetical protein
LAVLQACLEEEAASASNWWPTLQEQVAEEKPVSMYVSAAAKDGRGTNSMQWVFGRHMFQSSAVES